MTCDVPWQDTAMLLLSVAALGFACYALGYVMGVGYRRTLEAPHGDQ